MVALRVRVVERNGYPALIEVTWEQPIDGVCEEYDKMRNKDSMKEDIYDKDKKVLREP